MGPASWHSGKVSDHPHRARLPVGVNGEWIGHHPPPKLASIINAETMREHTTELLTRLLYACALTIKLLKEHDADA